MRWMNHRRWWCAFLATARLIVLSRFSSPRCWLEMTVSRRAFTTGRCARSWGGVALCRCRTASPARHCRPIPHWWRRTPSSTGRGWLSQRLAKAGVRLEGQSHGGFADPLRRCAAHDDDPGARRAARSLLHHPGVVRALAPAPVLTHLDLWPPNILVDCFGERPLCRSLSFGVGAACAGAGSPDDVLL